MEVAEARDPQSSDDSGTALAEQRDFSQGDILDMQRSGPLTLQGENNIAGTITKNYNDNRTINNKMNVGSVIIQASFPTALSDTTKKPIAAGGEGLRLRNYGTKSGGKRQSGKPAKAKTAAQKRGIPHAPEQTFSRLILAWMFENKGKAAFFAFLLVVNLSSSILVMSGSYNSGTLKRDDGRDISGSSSNTPGQMFRQPDRAKSKDEMQSTIRPPDRATSRDESQSTIRPPDRATSRDERQSTIRPPDHATSRDERQSTIRPPDHATSRDEMPDHATSRDETQSTIHSSTYTSSFPLHAAIRNGDQDTVYHLIYDESADINQKDNAGNTPLHFAASMGSQRLVNTLIKKGATVNAGNKLGRYPIHEACRSGHLEVVQILCEHGADVNVEDRQGASPLTETMLQSLDTIFDYLLDRGANIDAVDANSLLKSGKLLMGASRSSSGSTPLNIAAQLNSEYYVAKLLKQGAKINVPDSRGWEPLHTAAFHGNYANVLQLLKNNASVDALTKDTKATTALCLASQEGHLDVVVILLSHGAHVNHTQDDGASALFLAAQSGHVDVVDTLLKHGASIKVTLNEEESTPLLMAVQEGHAQVVNKILDRDYGWRKRRSASSAMCLAAFSGHLSVVKALLDQGARVDAKNVTANRTPLVYACQEGHLSVVRYLLDHGADISGHGGFSPLAMATFKNRSEIVRELAHRGADVNVPFTRVPLLGIACVFGYAEIAAILIDHGAPLGLYTEKDMSYFKKGYTYLMLASSCNHVGVAKVLIDRGADVNAQHPITGHTALMMAAFNGSAEVAKVLLQHGARPDLRAFDHSPLSMASLIGNHEVVKHLLSHGEIPSNDLQEAFFYACRCHFLLQYLKKELPRLLENYRSSYENLRESSDLNSALTDLGVSVLAQITEDYKKGIIKIDSRIVEAYKAAFEETVRVFLRHGVDVNMKDEFGHTALFDAVSGENLRIVQLLVEHGADVNAKNIDGFTALRMAVLGENLRIVQLLVEHGADVNAQDMDGVTALHVAVYGENLGIVQLLVEHGADVNAAQNIDGFTALHVAVYGENLSIIQLLVELGADVNAAQNKYGFTALHVAVSGKKLRIVQLLVEHGADVNARDSSGRTALDDAMNAGLPDIVDYLKSQKDVKKMSKSQKDVNARNEFTALDEALKARLTLTDIVDYFKREQEQQKQKHKFMSN